MNWQDVALGLAGGIGCLVAVVHGVVIERWVVKPIGKLVAADARMAPSTRRLVPPLLHLSTFAWLLGGLALIGAAIWLGRDAKLALGALVGSPEYPLLTTALGQALLFEVSADDIVIAAVPDTPVFRKLAETWRSRPLVRRAGIRIVLVARDGAVSGLDL